MRTLLRWLFPICALAVLVWGMDRAMADDTELPIAKCSGDMCVISREDWQQLRKFHIALLASMGKLQAENEILSSTVAELRAKQGHPG